MNSHNLNKNPYAKYHDRKREHSENVSENVEEYFNKRYDFYCEEKQGKMEPAELFTNKNWQIDQFQIMKHQLNQVKGQLSEFNLEEWSFHTKSRDPSGHVLRQLKKHVKPEILTQAWCKFYEIISQFPVINEIILHDKKLNSFHLCEAPGAFISALNHYLSTNYYDLEWNWLVNSLNPEYEGNDLKHMIPDKRLMNFTRNHWRFGCDNSGDLTKYHNCESLVSDAEKLGKVMLVTADGSVDCMSDPGEQESLVSHLHFCEVVTALNILAQGGSLVIKMFTMFESATVCLMYLLFNCFESLHVFKPCTSKSGNSEVYVICLNYKNKEEFMRLRDKFIIQYKNPSSDFVMFSSNTIPNKFVSQIEECNMFFMSKQIKTINDNIYCFKNVLPNAYRKNELIKNTIAQSFMHKYSVRPLDTNKYLITEIIDLNPTPDMFAFDDTNDNVIYNILFDELWIEKDIDVQFVIGKEISNVLYSEFCDIHILNDVRNLNQVLRSSIFTDLLTKVNIDYDCVLRIDYTDNVKSDLLNLFRNFYIVINKINCGHNIVILGCTFLTRFEVCLLFLLLYSFTKFEYHSGLLIVEKATSKLHIIREIFDKINVTLNQISSTHNDDFTPFILNILPDSVFRIPTYLKFLFDYNNSTLDFFLKSVVAR